MRHVLTRDETDVDVDVEGMIYKREFIYWSESYHDSLM